jgi:hypothetical protein
MGSRACQDCVSAPVMKCGRCTTTICQRHALAHNRRCASCERDWQAEAPTRRAAKLIFAPPIAILAGGLLFGVLLHVSLGMVGAVIMCGLVCGLAVGAGAAACHLVDHGSRVMFLRERAGGLPPMRLLSAPKR